MFERIKKCFNVLDNKSKYKAVHVYSDKSNNLFIIPTGESKKYGIVALDVIDILNHPYSDFEVEEALMSALDKCYSVNASDNLKDSPIAKHLGYKSYTGAVKGKRFTILEWNIDSGFTITPTVKAKGQGYIHKSQEAINLKCIDCKGDLGRTFIEIMAKSEIISE